MTGEVGVPTHAGILYVIVSLALVFYCVQVITISLFQIEVHIRVLVVPQ